MPSEAVSLALAASIYPPALAAVIALGRGQEVRLRVVLLVIAAYLTVFVTGTLMLLLFSELGATSQQVRTPSAGLYVLGGVVLILLAVRLRRRRPQEPKEKNGPSRTDRYLQSRWLILVLGIVLYVVPSPIYIGGVKAIADSTSSTSQQLRYLAQMLVIMLWIIELPMLMMIAFPDRAVRVLERINAWFGRHGRTVAWAAAGGVGVYLVIVGLVELL